MKPTKSLISVIIPVYNNGEELKKTIQSVYDTKETNFELIVVDDGSNPIISTIIQEYDFKLIRLEKNKGPSFARNIGVLNSSGRIILFTDSDCVVMKNWVKIISDTFLKYQNDQNELAALCGRVLPGNGFWERCHAYSGYGYVQTGATKRIQFLNTACVAIDRAAFLKVGGFSTDMRVGEDTELALKLCDSSYKIIYEPCISVFHNHGITTFNKFIQKHKNWGVSLSNQLVVKHKKYYTWLYKIYSRPALHLLLVLPFALLSTLKIVTLNIRYDKKILLYAFFILISKIFFRISIFWGSIQNENGKSSWKQKNIQFYKNIADSFDQSTKRKYSIAYQYYTLYPWIRVLKRSQKNYILDCGCGTGIASLELTRKGIQTVSLDISEELLHFLKNKAETEQLDCKCVVGDVENLPFGNHVFEGIICLGLLHHVSNIKNAVNSILGVIKNDGMILLSEPIRNKPWFSYVYYTPLNIFKFLKSILYLQRQGILEKNLTLADTNLIINLFEKHGFKCKVKRFIYWPFICALFPEMLAYSITQFLNSINLNPEKGDGLIISAKR